VYFWTSRCRCHNESFLKIDSLDNWCLRLILNIHWTEFVTNDEVCFRTRQPLLSDTVRSRHMSFFGHLNRSTTTELCRPALQTLLHIGDVGLAVPDNRGSEQWRPTCVHRTLAWRQQSDSSVFCLFPIAHCKVAAVPFASFTLNFIVLYCIAWWRIMAMAMLSTSS